MNGLRTMTEREQAIAAGDRDLPLYDRIDRSSRHYKTGVEEERERILAVAKAAPRASREDGRDLVVRTDIIRKIENPNGPV